MRVRSRELLELLNRRTLALGFTDILSVANGFDLGVSSRTLWRWRRSDRKVNLGSYRKIMQCFAKIEQEITGVMNVAS